MSPDRTTFACSGRAGRYIRAVFTIASGRTATQTAIDMRIVTAIWREFLSPVVLHAICTYGTDIREQRPRNSICAWELLSQPELATSRQPGQTTGCTAADVTNSKSPICVVRSSLQLYQNSTRRAIGSGPKPKRRRYDDYDDANDDDEDDDDVG